MALRLDEEKRSSRFERFSDVVEKRSRSSDLVSHPKGQREIEFVDPNPQSIRPGPEYHHTTAHPRPVGPAADLGQHLLVDVDRDHASCFADLTGHGDGKEARTATDIDGPVPRMKEPAQYPAGILNGATQTIVQDEG